MVHTSKVLSVVLHSFRYVVLQPFMPYNGKFGISFAIHKMNLGQYIQSKTISRFLTQVRDLVHQEVSELDLRSHVHPPHKSLVSHIFATTEGMNSKCRFSILPFARIQTCQARS